MPTVRVEETVEVSRDAIFAILTDHEGFNRFQGVRKCELVRAGESERNGLGALRRVYLGNGAVLDEAIVAYDAPCSYEYRVVRARPFPVKHELGRIELEAIGPNRTKVLWTSTFDIPVPVIGRAIAKRAAPQFSRAFRETIHTAAALAANEAA